jgi:hypothetical protein
VTEPDEPYSEEADGYELEILPKHALGKILRIVEHEAEGVIKGSGKALKRKCDIYFFIVSSYINPKIENRDIVADEAHAENRQG